MIIPEAIQQKIGAVKSRNRKARRAFTAVLKKKRRQLARANQRRAKRAVIANTEYADVYSEQAVEQ